MLRILRYQKATGNIIRRAISTKLNDTILMNETSDNVVQHTNPPNDKFTEEFLLNRIKLTEFQRFLLSAGSSIAALLDPYRHDMIACLGETTGESAIRKLLHQMKIDPEANQILIDKPRINTNTIDVEALGKQAEDTLGYYYYRFLQDNKVTPDSRANVKFMEDPELAYVMTRYRETHDLIHTILGMPTQMLGEVAVKWIEAINYGLPMCYGAAIFGAIRLKPKQRALYSEHYLPWALETGRACKPLLNVYWEKRWQQNIDEIRKELNIIPLTLFSKK